MKKAILTAVALGAALCVLLLLLPVSLPDLSHAERTLAMTEDGTVYLAENREQLSWVYGVDGNGHVNSVYREDGGTVATLTANGGDVYFLRKSRSSLGTSSRWQLLQLKGNAAELVLEAPDTLRNLPNGISVFNGFAYLSFLDEKGRNASVYQLPLSSSGERKLALLMEVTLPEGSRALSTVFAEDAFYFLTADGTLSRYRSAANQEVLMAGTKFSSLSANNGLVWVTEGNKAYIGGSGLTDSREAFSGKDMILCGAGTEKQSGAVLTTNGKSALLRVSGGKGTSQDVLLSFQRKLSFKTPLLLASLALYGICALILLLTVFFCRRFHRLAARVTSVCACLAVFSAALGGIAAVKSAASFREHALLAEAVSAGKARSAVLEGTDLSLLGKEDFQTSDAHTAMDNILADSDFTVDGETFYLSGALLDTDNLVAVSRTYPAGAALDILKSGEIGFAENKTEGSCLSASGNSLTASDIRPLYRYGKISGLLVTRVAGESTAEALQSYTRKVFLWGLLIAAAASLLIAFLAFRMMRPLRKLMKQMRAVSEGNFTMRAVKTGADEVGDLWQTMREMAVALHIKEYETNAMVRSFYRFVPRGLEKLLDRASIMETSLGDMAKVSGAVGILAIQNREEMRGSLSDRDFMGFVNDSFSAIDRQAAQNGALLLNNDFDLSGTEFLFPDVPGGGLAFGLGLLGETPRQADFFLLLHDTAFLYGMVGTEKRNFALLSSSELTFFHTLSRKFSGTGVHIAATEAYLKTLKTPCASRYIGFVSSEDGRFTCKLHQILDCCTDVEKNQCLSYDTKFQEAIGLFYQSDFYLARNSFSAILKSNPNDGVARWYLFACEHFFNSGDPDKAVYNLFGVEE